MPSKSYGLKNFQLSPLLTRPLYQLSTNSKKVNCYMYIDLILEFIYNKVNPKNINYI